MALTSQPAPEGEPYLTVEGKTLGELVPLCGMGCFVIYASHGVPTTIGCSYAGDILCCDVSSDDFCRSRCAWTQSCCCLDCRCAVPTDKVTTPFIINACGLTMCFQRALAFLFLNSVDDLREHERQKEEDADKEEGRKVDAAAAGTLDEETTLTEGEQPSALNQRRVASAPKEETGSNKVAGKTSDATAKPPGAKESSKEIGRDELELSEGRDDPVSVPTAAEEGKEGRGRPGTPMVDLDDEELKSDGP